MNKDKLFGYQLEEEKVLKDIDSKGYVLRHMKSGARIVLVENDDNNKTFCIGFRTPPTDNTGAAHIMEHSVLCGSRKFPVKDPFMELVKGSLNTFLNAMTYPDKTLYPVASTNDKDFQNMMDVYLDSVFHPKVYDREMIFAQEGFNLSMENEDAPLTYNGVVYNEMKGAFSSPDDVVARAINHSLFPDTCYGVESAGDPEYIPELTYEKFLDFHKKYYHPSNSYIYIYGDMDMNQTLEWLDEQYLSEYDCEEIDSSITYQKAFTETKDIRKEYSISESESLEDNTYLSYNFVVGDCLDPVRSIAFSMLEYAIASMPGSPISKALLEKGIGKDSSGNYQGYLLQPVFSFMAENANESDKEEFVKVIRETLQSLVENGIDKKALTSVLNNAEFQYRENDFGSWPKGLMYGLQIYDNWIYDDKDVFRQLELNEAYAFLREMIESDYYEKLIQKYFLDNTHAAVVTVVPVRGLTEQKDEELRKKLADRKAKMSKEEILAIVEKTKALKQYHDTPSTKEELDTIPVLELSDLSCDVEPIYNTEREIDGTCVVQHDLFTNGIAYVCLSFDVTDIPTELLPYLPILKGLIGYMNTQKYSYSELSNEIGTHTGCINFEIGNIVNANDGEKYRLSFDVIAKSFTEKIPEMIGLIEEMILHTDYSDEKRMYEIFCEGKSDMMTGILQHSDTYAAIRGLSSLNRVRMISEITKGITNYQNIERIANHFDEEKQDVIDKVNILCKYVFRKDNLTISITAQEDGYRVFEANIHGLLDHLEERNDNQKIFENMTREIVCEKINEGFMNSAQVQYVARCGDFSKHGFSFTPSLYVLRTILNSEYLWKNIREKGGAYGCNCSFGRFGESYFSSFRDPNLEQTDKVFDGVADYIRTFDCDDRTMTKYIIGTISGMVTPLTVRAKGVRSRGFYFSGRTLEDVREERMQILNTRQSTIRQLADLVEAILKDENRCVIGNSANVKDAEKMFDEVKPIFSQE